MRVFKGWISARAREPPAISTLAASETIRTRLFSVASVIWPNTTPERADRRSRPRPAGLPFRRNGRGSPGELTAACDTFVTTAVHMGHARCVCCPANAKWALIGRRSGMRGRRVEKDEKPKSNGAGQWRGPCRRRHYLDADGRPVAHPLTLRVINPSLDDLLRVPELVLADGGLQKVSIIRAAIRARLCHVLITDEDTARALMTSVTCI
jgi:hypothetical protein